MKSKYLLLFSALLICFSLSCTKNNTAQPLTIAGTWNLQQQHAVMHVNGVVVVDTVFNASNLSYASVQFNKNGTFSSISVYVPTVFNNRDPGSSGNSQGTYSVSDAGVSISPYIAGWFNYVPGTAPPPTLSSSSVEVKSLTSTTLNIRIEDVFSYITNVKSTTVRTINDFSFTK